MGEVLKGLVIKAQSGFFTVRTDRGPVVCQLRGRLKRERQDTDLAALGDRVIVELLPDGTGVVESVIERKRVLARRAPNPRGRGAGDRLDHREREIEQVIVANPDQAVFVFACAQPALRGRMLDRFLVVAEANEIPALICANKTDLVAAGQARALFGLYADIGYTVIYTSAVSGAGVDRLRRHLQGRLSVLAGPSGVGKTSLLNAVQPGLGLTVRAVSHATSKGRHTTVHPELFRLDDGGWVADTPGLRALALFDVEPEELDGYFVDIAPLVAGCDFSDCAHVHEPGCAVLAAVEGGALHPSRYESYRRMRLGEPEFL